MPNRRSLVALLVLALAGCKSGQAPRSNKSTSGTTSAAVAAAAPQPTATQAPAPVEPAPAPANAHDMEWKSGVAWHTWDEAQSLSKRESKPIMVLVYADWCPHCRALAPAFSDPQVEELARKFVMVRQNHDDDPAWLEPYNKKFGGYVPRIFFFDPKGQMREDIVSGHPRYPYFYAAEHIDLLKQSMRRVIGS